jgi:hypothetical protein
MPSSLRSQEVDLKLWGSCPAATTERFVAELLQAFQKRATNLGNFSCFLQPPATPGNTRDKFLLMWATPDELAVVC